MKDKACIFMNIENVCNYKLKGSKTVHLPSNTDEARKKNGQSLRCIVKNRKIGKSFFLS